MEIQELRVFVAIVDCGGFQNAAKELGLTQPAVSQSLANLERKIGEALVHRPSKEITPIGYELLKHARYVIESELEFNAHLSRLKLGHLKSISIAADHLTTKYYCPQLIAQFNKKLPEANIKIRRMPAREIILAIKSKQYDVGIGPFQKNMDGFEKIPLLKAESFLVTGKSNPALKIYKKDPIAFLRETTLLTSYLDDPNARPSKKKIRDYFKGLWEINDINLQLELITRGIGATFIAKQFLENEPIKKDIVVLDKVPFALIKKEYGAYFLKQNTQNETISEFIKTLKMSVG